jgi:hypothetical protein
MDASLSLRAIFFASRRNGACIHASIACSTSRFSTKIVMDASISLRAIFFPMIFIVIITQIIVIISQINSTEIGFFSFLPDEI